MSKRLKTITVVGGLLLLVAVVLGFRIHEFNNPPEFPSNEQLQQEFGVPVEVAPVELRTITALESFTGTVEGYSQTEVLSEVSQKVIRLKVKVGSRVSQNDILAEMDTRSVSNTTLRYAQTVAGYEDAKLNFERMKNLYEAGAIPKQSYDQARLNYDVQKANYEAVISAVNIKSPISGIVTETYVEAGDRVNVNQPVAKVVSFDKVKIRIQVNESEIARVRSGQACVVSTTSLDREFPGTVGQIALSADPRTRNFEVEVSVDNPDLALRAGMFARVRIIFDNRNQVPAIHKDALIKTGEGYQVYTVLPDSSITRKAVTVGATDGSYYEILSGLTPGEQIIIEGFNNIRGEKQKAIVIK